MIDTVTDFDLRRLNTLALPSVADRACRVATIDEVTSVIDTCADTGIDVEVLGGGSNVVLRDHLRGCLLLPALRWIRAEDRGDRVRLHVGAGIVWHDLVRYSIGQGLSGIENLALIPGSVGAAPIQNIGAYGVELERVFRSLTAVSCRDGARREWSREACGFGYRDSAFKRDGADRHVIVEICLELSRDLRPVADYPDVRDELARIDGRVDAARIAEAVIRVRRRKLPDPRRVPNAGSFFKNPVVGAAAFDALREALPDIAGYPAPGGVKVPAARLIDACGWKGRRLGPVGVWHRQALVLVNLGGASAADVLRLADAIIDDVGARFRVELEIEPRIIGEDRVSAGRSGRSPR